MNTPVVIGRLVSVNVGQARTVAWFGRQVTSAIWKSPVAGPAAVSGTQMAGDKQADHRVHGGYVKAIYAYAVEDYRWWSCQGHALAPGTFGENLTTEGIDLTATVVGERWLTGSATVEVSEPRLPCYKLGIGMGDAELVDRIDEASRFGTYLRIVSAGELAAGCPINRISRPAGGITVGDMTRSHHHPPPALLARIAARDEVPQPWRTRAERAIARHQAR